MTTFIINHHLQHAADWCVQWNELASAKVLWRLMQLKYLERSSFG